MCEMNPELSPISEWRDVDEATFRDRIVAQYRPDALRGSAAQWLPAPQAPLHAFSARADRESVYRSARPRADGNADQPRLVGESGLQALSAFPRSARRGVGRGARSGRRRLYSDAVVASRRVARQVQHAGQLLVERTGRSRCGRFGAQLPAALSVDTQTSA